MKRSKFNVDKDKAKRTCNGIVFDSELEMKYYRDVVLPGVKSGRIKYYELQKPYELQSKFVHDGKIVQPIKYVADFYIEYADGSSEVIDTKGIPDSTAIIKRKMFWYVYPDIKYIWVTWSKIDGGWCSYEYVKQQRSLRRKNKKEHLK